MNLYYTETPDIYPEKLPDFPIDGIRGHAWSAFPENGKYIFEYISGELAGRLKKIQISLEEFENLKHGRTTDAAILLAHGAY
jgi:hypothetical protein